MATEDERFEKAFQQLQEESEVLDKMVVKTGELQAQFADACELAQAGALTKQGAWEALVVLKEYKRSRDEYEAARAEFDRKWENALAGAESYMERYLKKMV